MEDLQLSYCSTKFKDIYILEVIFFVSMEGFSA